MVYAGIGSRETPDKIIELMASMSESLANKGYVLRSGGADGADVAFERGCDKAGGKKEIYLPWKGFNNNFSIYYLPYDLSECNQKAVELAREYHPGWDRLKIGAAKMMVRNSHQVFGWNMNSPVDFIICYTPDGKASGGTGQALRIAHAYGIKVYNLRDRVSENVRLF